MSQPPVLVWRWRITNLRTVAHKMLPAWCDACNDLQSGHSDSPIASRVLVGLGGSATNDAGLGTAASVGYKFLRAAEKEGK